MGVPISLAFVAMLLGACRGHQPSGFTYRLDWNTVSSGEVSVEVIPVSTMPAAHPKVTGTVCGETFAAGSPIPANSFWSTSGAATAGGAGCTSVTSGEMFYAYNYPSTSSGNSGYNRRNTLSIYMINDDANDAYIVLSVDIPNSGQTGGDTLSVDITSTGIPGARVILSDDAGEVTWDTATGVGSATWGWSECCTDGAVIGPLPRSGFTLDLTADRAGSSITDVEFITLDPAAGPGQVARRTYSFASLQSSTRFARLSGFTTAEFCASFSTCGECALQSQCACDGGTCKQKPPDCYCDAWANGLTSAMAIPDLCTNTCAFSSDGMCDDGGLGSTSSLCAIGNDCVDCSPRTPAYTPACHKREHDGHVEALSSFATSNENRVNPVDIHDGRIVCRPTQVDPGGAHYCPADHMLCVPRYTSPVFENCGCGAFRNGANAADAIGTTHCRRLVEGAMTCMPQARSYDPNVGDGFQYYGCPHDHEPCTHTGASG